MRMTTMCKKIAGITMATLVVGFVLMLVVYALPVGRMKNNIAESHEIFNYEGQYPQITQDFKSMQLDNYTDALMYATAIHPGNGNLIKDALSNARYEYRDTNMAQSLNDYANNVVSKEEQRYEMHYSRYWHGYLIILKPLLLFFNVSEIRMMNMIMQGTLFLGVLYWLRKRIGEQYQLPYFVMILVLNPIVLPLSLQFSWVFYVGILGTLGILIPKEIWLKQRYILWFWFVGMLTSYVDLLTYPVFTYGLPLITLLLLCRNEGWSKQVNYIVSSGLAWGLGYAIMWIGKWIFTWMFSGGNIFRDVIDRILLRASARGYDMEELSAATVLIKNISVLMKWPYLLLFIIIILVLCLMKKKCSFKMQLENTIPYVIIAIMPIVWLVVKSNHSYIHYWFTFRELSISIMAVIVGVMESMIGQTDV